MRKMLVALLALLMVFLLPGCAGAPLAPANTPSLTVAGASGQPVLTTLPADPIATGTPSATSTLTATATPAASSTSTASATPAATGTSTPALLTGAGDISICGLDTDDATAALLDGVPGAIFTAGDNSNESGTIAQYTRCFGPTWGRQLDRMYPAIGNHDYGTPGAPDYFAYFGQRAGQPGQGYYSYELGSWHLVVLNSNCGQVIGGCGAKSAQVQWLRDDLAAHPADCTLAVFHHPRFTSGPGGNATWLAAFWQVLYDAGAEIVVSGDDHQYERFAPQDPQGNRDEARGLREFVVGTGGASPVGFFNIQPNSEARVTGDYGVIQFALYPGRYEWSFIPAAGSTFTDAGSGDCHR